MIASLTGFLIALLLALRDSLSHAAIGATAIALTVGSNPCVSLPYRGRAVSYNRGLSQPNVKSLAHRASWLGDFFSVGTRASLAVSRPQVLCFVCGDLAFALGPFSRDRSYQFPLSVTR